MGVKVSPGEKPSFLEAGDGDNATFLKDNQHIIFNALLIIFFPEYMLLSSVHVMTPKIKVCVYAYHFQGSR